MSIGAITSPIYAIVQPIPVSAKPSLAQFVTGPTISQISAAAWDVLFGAEIITISARPVIATPTATFGAEQITVTG